MSNEGIEPGQVWELRQDGTGRSILLFVTLLEEGSFGSLIGMSLEDGRLISLNQTTIGLLKAEHFAKRIM